MKKQDPIDRIRKIIHTLREITDEFRDVKNTAHEVYEVSCKEAENSFNRTSQKASKQLEKIIELQNSLQTMLIQANMPELLEKTESPLPSDWKESDDPEQRLDESVSTLERLCREAKSIIQQAAIIGG